MLSSDLFNSADEVKWFAGSCENNSIKWFYDYPGAIQAPITT